MSDSNFPLFNRLSRVSAASPAPLAEDLSPTLRLWLLRILVPLGGHLRFVREHGFDNEWVADALGCAELSNQMPFDQQAARLALRQQYQKYEKLQKKQPELFDIPPILAQNVARLAQLVGLSDVDQHVLAFVAMLHHDRLLDDAADQLGPVNTGRLVHMISVLIGADDTAVRQALDPRGALARSGLVMVDRNGSYMLKGKLELLSASFADHLINEQADPVALLRETLLPTTPAQLTLADYPHLAAELALMESYLRQALATRQRGVNIFIYGVAGTGKSQMARVMAQRLNQPLYEVASEDQDGDPVDAMQRLRAYRAAQSVFARQSVLLVFDEIEDVFNDNLQGSGMKGTAQSRKAWVNRMLEDNPVPAFWISNASHLDPAFVRRFDLVIEVPVAPERQRAHMIGQVCGDLLHRDRVAKLATHAHLAPAVISRAAHVVRRMGAQWPVEQTSPAIEQLVSATLHAQGYGRLRQHDPNALPDYYDPTLINTDTPLEKIADGLSRHAAGRLCLYGAAGTGKTAFARWLALRLDKPLLVKRGSDLLSRWVGGTEQNLAEAFAQANDENAVLLIDEVDSFLQNRNHAQQTWEISAVNELLTQMEGFAGILVASTNRMDDLDPAALRRFDLKLRFGYLKPEQAWRLLQSTSAHLGLPLPPADLQPVLAGLSNLTAGDFAAVTRQAKFNPVSSAAELVTALQQECALKQGSKASMGFI